MFKLKHLRLKRWQIWLLILVALWMIYSGLTQLQREGRGPFSDNKTDAYVKAYAVLNSGERDNGQCI